MHIFFFSVHKVSFQVPGNPVATPFISFDVSPAAYCISPSFNVIPSVLLFCRDFSAKNAVNLVCFHESVFRDDSTKLISNNAVCLVVVWRHYYSAVFVDHRVRVGVLGFV